MKGVLVSDGTFRMCTDYRKVNSATKTYTFPIPRLDDCIDIIGHAKYVTKSDLLKGFRQKPLTDRAKKISAFVFLAGQYQYKSVALKCSLVLLVNILIFGLDKDTMVLGLDGCKAYIDDLQRRVGTTLGDYQRTLQETCHDNLTFVGHIAGQGQSARPADAKDEAISDFSVHTGK